jgi:hypothetical protein
MDGGIFITGGNQGEVKLWHYDEKNNSVKPGK